MDEKKSIQLKSLSVYFYHTRLTSESYEAWKRKEFPGHLLYGATHFEANGIRTIMHRYRYFPKRFQLMLYSTKEILFCKQKFDVLYASSFRGIEPLIFLRALGLFRKPIIIWHHTAITKSKNKWKEFFSRLFYKGIDHMFLFSQKLIDDSLETHKVNKKQISLIHWGADLSFYDHLKEKYPVHSPSGFISTGKENRDLDTLLDTFTQCNQQLTIYIAHSCGKINYDQIIARHKIGNNIKIHFATGVIPEELAKKVIQSQCIVIACLDFPYTVGLTTLIEAFALGLPVICSRNPNFNIDIETEKVGITINYGDIQGWINAVTYISNHPEEAQIMGKNGRHIAEKTYNLDHFAQEIIDILQKYAK